MLITSNFDMFKTSVMIIFHSFKILQIGYLTIVVSLSLNLLFFSCFLSLFTKNRSIAFQRSLDFRTRIPARTLKPQCLELRLARYEGAPSINLPPIHPDVCNNNINNNNNNNEASN